MFPQRLMKADWDERAERRQGACPASAPPGNHKGPASRGDHGPANPRYPLKRTDIVWPAL